jgi:hypothetical protein
MEIPPVLSKGITHGQKHSVSDVAVAIPFACMTGQFSAATPFDITGALAM